jgi:hypothetical protein
MGIFGKGKKKSKAPSVDDVYTMSDTLGKYVSAPTVTLLEIHEGLWSPWWLTDLLSLGEHSQW